MTAVLEDHAGIFTGETEEAFGLMQYAVMRDPGRLELAQRVMTETMLRVVDRFSAKSTREGGTDGSNQ